MKHNGVSVDMKRFPKIKLRMLAAENPRAINDACPKPATWGGCIELELGTKANPCPYVSCSHHNYVTVDPANGAIRIDFPGDDIADVLSSMEHTCSLRAAEEGGMTLEHVGSILNVHKERIRQIEEEATRAIERSGMDLRELHEEICEMRSRQEPGLGGALDEASDGDL